jgi:addiction module RelB/DinJ family antitoxin
MRNITRNQRCHGTRQRKGAGLTTVRIDENLERDFVRIVEEIGLDAPTVVRMLIVQTVRQKRVPLSLSVAGETPDTLDFLDSVRADWGEW